MDPEALHRLLDRGEHLGHGIALLRRERDDVRAAVAVLRHLLAAPQRLHRGAETVYLRAGVVVVVLALDVVAAESEEPCDTVPERAAAAPHLPEPCCEAPDRARQRLRAARRASPAWRSPRGRRARRRRRPPPAASPSRAASRARPWTCGSRRCTSRSASRHPA